MKVKIGPYRDWFGPYQLCNLLRFVGVPEKYRDKLSDIIPGKPFEWIHDNLKTRKIKIRIDPYDTWSVDHTLALIIVPMLKQLKARQHGAPNVDDEDVLENLRSINAKPKEDWEVDEFHFDRWDYVMDEMIFAFEHIADTEWEDKLHSGKMDWEWICKNPEETDKEKLLWETKEGPNHTYKFDQEGFNAVNKRIDNGLRLFGKYYRNLWD